jgi:hypothetical protein
MSSDCIFASISCISEEMTSECGLFAAKNRSGSLPTLRQISAILATDFADSILCAVPNRRMGADIAVTPRLMGQQSAQQNFLWLMARGFLLPVAR